MSIRFTLAVGHYDRHLPLLETMVIPEGIELYAIEVGNAEDRHRRMLQYQEFDGAEVSLSSYIMARARRVPVTAIPVFPRRLFSQSAIYVNANAGIESPRDLIGKRVGLNSYQTTLSVWSKGDLQHEYGVPLTGIKWLTAVEEIFPFTAPRGVAIERIAPGKKLSELLETGEIDAVMTPRTPSPVLQGSTRVRRLFLDARAEEISYFRRLGFYPIMHTVAVRDEVLIDNPQIASRLLQAFDQSKEICYRRYYDPNWSHLAWAHLLFQEQRQLMGTDPWPNGLAHNRANLERFIAYSWEQGLIENKPPVESLFAETTLET